MQILQTETLFGWGGQQRKVLLECLALRELGHHVTLVCNPGSKIYGIFREYRLKVITLKMTKKRYLIGAFQLAKVISDFKIDLVISHGSTDSWISLLASRLSNRRPTFFRERHNLYPISGALSRWLHQQGAQKILSISQTVSKYLVSVGVPSDHLSYLPDAVDPFHFDPQQKKSSLRDELGISENTLIIGSLTSHRRDKGIYELARFAREILIRNKDICFVFAGSYKKTDRNAIESSLLSEPDLNPRIKWTGYRDDPQNVLNSFDIFVHLTKIEGLGTVTLEAMYCGKPVIAWSIPAMQELIQDEINGYLSPIDDFSQLIDSAEKLISNPALRKKIGINNQLYVDKIYSFEQLRNRLNYLINNI